MKAMCMGMAVVALGALASQGEPGISQNVAGYTRWDLFATTKVTRLYLVRNDYVGLTGPQTIASAFSNQLPLNSQLLFWNDQTQLYLPAVARSGLGWGRNGTNELPRGMGFWIRMPALTIPSNVTVLIAGEIPDAAIAPTTTLVAVPGYNFDGYPYPVPMKWTNTQYAKGLPLNSQLTRWDSTNQLYMASVTKSWFAWGLFGNAWTIEPGVGFYIRSNVSTNVVVSEPKPYAWP
jgi:hypothetical protein